MQTLLADRGRDYLDARARLEAHPDVATDALLARLGTEQGPAERSRLLSVLSGMDAPGLSAMLAEQLRASLLGGQGEAPWLEMLVSRGAEAVEPLAHLVGDQELELAQRAVLLDALVQAMPTPRIDELVAMVGRGHSDLQQQLARSLVRRARSDRASVEPLVSGLGRVIDDAAAPGRPRAAALALLSRVQPDDPALTGRLVGIVDTDDGPFILQAGAARALGGRGPDADAALGRLVERHADAARALDQRSELLVAEALAALPDPTAVALADRLDLRTSPAPRLASLGWALQSLPAGHGWLDEALEHPWPEVRAASLGRVDGSCENDTVKRLSTAAGPQSGGGDADGRVGRAALMALGRCGGKQALGAVEKVLRSDGVPFEQRASAGQVLIETDPARGIEAVVDVLRSDPPPGLAEQLAATLGMAAEPSPEQQGVLVDALCRAAQSYPNAARTSLDSMRKVAPGARCEE